MMLKVLLALDGRAHSKQTLTFAIDWLKGREVTVVLFHVIPQHIVFGRAGVAAEVYDMPAERARSAEMLRDCAAYLEARDVGPTIVRAITVGDPGDLIFAAAQAYTIDLIIIGSHEANAIRRFLAGSTATRVSTYAHCPVLVAHAKTTSHVDQSVARDDAARLG